MLDSLVRNSFVRYAALAGTLLVSNPTYAQTASGSSEGAYYIDPAKRRELQEKKERERAAAAPAPATAQESRPLPESLEVACNTAKECFREGMKLYQEKDFGRAVEFFKRTYNLESRPEARKLLLYHTALAHEKSGDAVASISYYELFLQERPRAEQKEDIQRKMPGLRMYAEADRLQEVGKHREAVKLYREAHALTSDSDTLVAITQDRERSERQLSEKAERPSAPILDYKPNFKASEEVPPYVAPPNAEAKNTGNDTAGYILTVAGAGLTALVLIRYAFGDECPEGIQEGGIVKECHRHIGWPGLSIGIASMGVGLYFIFD